MPGPVCVRLPVPLIFRRRSGRVVENQRGAIVQATLGLPGTRHRRRCPLAACRPGSSCAAVGVAAQQGQNARAGLRQTAAAADAPATVGLCMGENKAAVVEHAARAERRAPPPPLPTCKVPAEIVVLPL